jgi:hypothetical protein
MAAKLLHDQRGVVLLMTCLVLVAILLLAGIGTDLARAWVAREDLQTAADAAALAGSRSGERYVKITVRYGHCNYCCNKDGECSCCCECEWPETLTGKEKYLIDNGGWRKGTCCDSFLGIEDRWIEYPAETYDIADSILGSNWPQLMQSGGGGEEVSSDITIYDRQDPFGPSARVRASGAIKTTLLKLAGIEEISTNRCGQAATFYEIVSGGWLQGRNAPPQDACQ